MNFYKEIPKDFFDVLRGMASAVSDGTETLDTYTMGIIVFTIGYCAGESFEGVDCSEENRKKLIELCLKINRAANQSLPPT